MEQSHAERVLELVELLTTLVRPDLARPLLDRLRAEEPDHPGMEERLEKVVVLGQVPEPPPPLVSSVVGLRPEQFIERCLFAGALAMARDLLGALLTCDIGPPQAGLGLVERLNALQRVLERLARREVVHPLSKSPSVQQADHLVAQGRLFDAIEEFRMVLEQEPNAPGVHAAIGDLERLLAPMPDVFVVDVDTAEMPAAEQHVAATSAAPQPDADADFEVMTFRDAPGVGANWRAPGPEEPVAAHSAGSFTGTPMDAYAEDDASEQTQLSVTDPRARRLIQAGDFRRALSRLRLLAASAGLPEEKAVLAPFIKSLEGLIAPGPEAVSPIVTDAETALVGGDLDLALTLYTRAAEERPDRLDIVARARDLHFVLFGGARPPKPAPRVQFSPEELRRVLLKRGTRLDRVKRTAAEWAAANTAAHGEPRDDAETHFARPPAETGSSERAKPGPKETKRLELAESLERSGSLDEALRIYQELSDEDVLDDALRDRILQVRQAIAAQRDPDSTRVMHPLTVADQLRLAGYLRQALDRYELVLEQRPDDTTLRERVEELRAHVARHEEQTHLDDLGQWRRVETAKHKDPRCHDLPEETDPDGGVPGAPEPPSADRPPERQDAPDLSHALASTRRAIPVAVASDADEPADSGGATIPMMFGVGGLDDDDDEVVTSAPKPALKQVDHERGGLDTRPSTPMLDDDDPGAVALRPVVMVGADSTDDGEDVAD